MVYGMFAAAFRAVFPHESLIIGGNRGHVLTILQKQKQQQDANADAAAGNKRKKVTAAQLRVQKGHASFAPTSTHASLY